MTLRDVTLKMGGYTDVLIASAYNWELTDIICAKDIPDEYLDCEIFMMFSEFTLSGRKITPYVRIVLE